MKRTFRKQRIDIPGSFSRNSAADPRSDRFRCGGRESEFLLMQSHPEG